MDRQALYREILEDARELARRAAHPRRGTLSVSPEVRALLEGAPSAPAEQAAASEAPDPGDSRVTALAGLAERVAACTQCALCESRTQTVFSDGSPWARLVFVGEAPGADEDRQGTPFVGRAGQLLTDIIVKGMRLRREDVYICNVIKCRPPGNRNPAPEEVAACEPYLIEQLKLIQPEAICALGSYAARSLLKTEASVGSLRGQWHDYQGIPLRVTYHPSYLLRNPADKRKAWDDIKAVMERLDLPVEA